MIEDIFKILSSNKFSLLTEKVTQGQIQSKLLQHGIIFTREHYLDKNNIPDFFIAEVGMVIEVKLKGTARNIYKQCERYCEFEQVKQLILLTNKSMGFPDKINNKPCYILNLGKSWL